MAEEVELKLALAEADQARFLRHPLLKLAVERRTENLDNIYYDTAELSLRHRGIALRLRRKGRDWLQTIKLAGRSAAGLSSRPEWETPYSGRFDFSLIDQSGVREWLQRPRLLAGIVPICETRFRRISWRFGAGPGAVLVTLDRGWIIANGRREAISEIELELDGAPVHAIFDLAIQFGQRVALTPSVVSKAERGYRLHAGTAPTPIKAEELALSATMLPFEAFHRIALSCLEHLQQNHSGALSSEDPEYIHQMRVATRRLRAALRLFAPILPESLANPLEAPLSALMQQLGCARDLDVLLSEIVDPVLAALPKEPRLPALSSEITNRRYMARAETLAMLAAPEYGRMLLTALESLHAPPPTEQGRIDLLEFAADRLRRLRKKLKQQSLAARIEDPASLHVMRIGVKRLRYALEFFSPLADQRALQRALKQLATMQDALGQLNDLTNAGSLLMNCAGDDPGLREAVTLIGGWHGRRYAKLLKKIARAQPRITRLRLPELAPAAESYS
ncbi:MAG: CHAD domain-containing protein [Burkholderiaceae bacterium]|nr:CHAD domain-containing protein [Sulfuritalea sp.]MCF8174920.1 CHAD domain-containing protein [Burkholderiaceae bacterium]MCF8183583.1 CHAD domain-containing protein [Polynucleobacter sp.]